MQTIDGILFKQMIISGANNLFNHYPEVDTLNVFPVPDGDTGTNMNLTMSSGLKEIANRNDKSIYNIAKCFSRGLLMGARGNSGVILSQIFRGFANGVKGKDEIDAVGLAEAFDCGREVAYKAVMQPVEGTILTVVREASAVLMNKVRPGMAMDEAIEIFYKEALASLERTPNLLPVLKEVGVVDSGGAGFCKIIEGFVLALKNKIVQRSMPDVTTVDNSKQGGSKIGFGKSKSYDVAFKLMVPVPEAAKSSGKREFSLDRFKAVFKTHGSDFEVTKNGNEVKAKILTKFPGNILSFAQQYGEFASIEIIPEGGAGFGARAKENEKKAEETSKPVEEPVKEETEVTIEEEVPTGEEKEFGMIAVSSGSGISELFKANRVDVIVSGGQTMNPSTEDFIKAIRKVNAKNIFIFPNNGNIIMAANTAKDMTEDKNIVVIPSKTIPQGLVASMNFNPEVGLEENEKTMNEALASVKSGEVTYAIRDTAIDGVEVQKDDYMGLQGKKIIISFPDKVVAAKKLLDSMVDDLSSVITIICGADVKPEEKEKFVNYVNKKYGEQGIDVDVVDGKQPVYSFILSVE